MTHWLRMTNVCTRRWSASAEVPPDDLAVNHAGFPAVNTRMRSPDFGLEQLAFMLGDLVDRCRSCPGPAASGWCEHLGSRIVRVAARARRPPIGSRWTPVASLNDLATSLEPRANQLALHLLATGTGGGPVALLFDGRCTPTSALQPCLKINAAYVRWRRLLNRPARLLVEYPA